MIVIYTIAGCESCRHAISLSKFKKIEHRVVELKTQDDVEKLRSERNLKSNLLVPLIFNDNELVGSLPEYKKWVDNNPYK